VIHDVDESLRELVRREVLTGANVEISFEAPNRDWSARRNAPTINLYLYEIREDLERRNIQIEELRDDNGLVVERRPPPRRFKLSYLVTAWTQRPEDEHRVLASLLECFLAFDALPADVLQGSLVDQPYPVRTTIGLPLPPERSISDVWTALGGELKASLDLIVTTPFETGRTRPIGPPVLEEPRIRIGGPNGSDPLRRAGRGAGPEPGGKGAVASAPGEAAEETVPAGRGRGKAASVGPDGTAVKDPAAGVERARAAEGAGGGGTGPAGERGRRGAPDAPGVGAPGNAGGATTGRGAPEAGRGWAPGQRPPVEEIRGGRGESGRRFRMQGLPRR
jgi:hypothetical protein